MRRLIDNSFVPANQRTSVLYCRLSDFKQAICFERRRRCTFDELSLFIAQLLHQQKAHWRKLAQALACQLGVKKEFPHQSSTGAGAPELWSSKQSKVIDPKYYKHLSYVLAHEIMLIISILQTLRCTKLYFCICFAYESMKSSL